MSTGIGFAGYGKYLNDRALALRGKKHTTNSNPYDANIDMENTEVNQLEDLLQWSKKRREVSRPRRILLLSFRLFFLINMIALVIFMLMHAFG